MCKTVIFPVRTSSRNKLCIQNSITIIHQLIVLRSCSRNSCKAISLALPLISVKLLHFFPDAFHHCTIEIIRYVRTNTNMKYTVRSHIAKQQSIFITPPVPKYKIFQRFYYGLHTDVYRHTLQCRLTHFALYVVYSGISKRSYIQEHREQFRSYRSHLLLLPKRNMLS